MKFTNKRRENVYHLVTRDIRRAMICHQRGPLKALINVIGLCLMSGVSARNNSCLAISGSTYVFINFSTYVLQHIKAIYCQYYFTICHLQSFIYTPGNSILSGGYWLNKFTNCLFT